MINIFETLANNISPVYIGTRCKCENVEVGSYDNQVEVPAPQHIIDWAEKTGFSLGGDRKTICIDKCLGREIKALWEKGVITTGCCCGHGKVQPYIGVESKSASTMKALGYRQLNGFDFEPMTI